MGRITALTLALLTLLALVTPVQARDEPGVPLTNGLATLVPIYATSYNWQLGGVNCDEDCSQFSSGLFTHEDLLGHVAACPAVWVGRPLYINGMVTRWVTTVVLFPDHDIEPRYCVDVFGAPRNRHLVWLPESPYRAGGFHVWRVDFAEAVPGAFPYNQRVLRSYRTVQAAIPVEWYEREFLLAKEYNPGAAATLSRVPIQRGPWPVWWLR